MYPDPNCVIDRLGGTSETARICEVSAPAVSEWRRHGIPRSRLQFLRLARPDVFLNSDGSSDVGKGTTPSPIPEKETTVWLKSQPLLSHEVE